MTKCLRRDFAPAPLGFARKPVPGLCAAVAWCVPSAFFSFILKVPINNITLHLKTSCYRIFWLRKKYSVGLFNIPCEAALKGGDF